MKSFIEWWNGKKTIIGLGILALCGQPFFIDLADNPAWLIPALEWIGGILAAGGLLHKGAKKLEKNVKNAE